MAITLGGGSGSPRLQVGWNPCTFKDAVISQSPKTGKDYLKLTFEVNGNDVPMFQSEPSKGGYIGQSELLKTVNSFISMYAQVSRPVVEGTVKEVAEQLLADYATRCTEFEAMLAEVFSDFDQNKYKEMDEADQLVYLGNYFTDCACKAFCDDNTENILKYVGTRGYVFGHWVNNSGNWFVNPVSFNKACLHTYKDGVAVMKNGYPVTVSFSPFTTEDDETRQQIGSQVVEGKYGIVLQRGANEPKKDASTQPVAATTTENPVENW